MATTQRQFPGMPVNGAIATVQAADSSTTGIKLTYTCPAGRQAKVTAVGLSSVIAGPTIAIQGTPNGQVRTFRTAAAQDLLLGGWHVDAGETVRLNVTAASPATTFDGFISAEEYLAQ